MSQEDTDTQAQGATTTDDGAQTPPEGDAAAAAELQRAQDEARTTREAADAAKAAAENDKSTVAQERATLAQERADLAETQARSAARATNADGSKKYDEAYVKKLRDEAAGHRVKANEQATRVKQLEDEKKTDAERSAERISESDRRAETAEHRLAQIEAAIATKLPLDLAQRLVGDTYDELKKDAAKLAAAVKPTEGQGLDQGQRGGGVPDPDKPSDMNNWLRRRAGVGQ